MGIRTRFSLFFLLVSLLSLGSFAAVIFYQFQTKLISNAEQNLSLHLEHEWRHFEFPKGSNEEHFSEASAPHLKDIYQRFWRDGALFYDSFPKTFNGSIPKTCITEKAFVIRLKKEHDNSKFDLLGYYDLTSTRSYLNELRNLLVAGCFLAGLILFPLSLFCTKILLRPFTRLAQRTSELQAEQLSFRFPPPKHTDEYGTLIQSFNDLLNRLEKSFSQLRLFAGNASHELRTPVAAIIGQAEMHLRRHPENQSEDGSVSKILSQAKRLSNIIGQLLFLSEVDRAEQENRRSVISVNERIHDVIDIFNPRFRPLGKTLSVIESEKNLLIKTNPELLLVVISNLVENALKFSKSQVRIETQVKAKNFTINVEDDGPGIPKEDRHDVLTPFVKSATTGVGAKNDGYGLGLSIAKACVDALEGTMLFEKSALGGLKATISLPVTT